MSEPAATSNHHAEAVKELMLQHDAFSKLLGLQVDEVGPGYCRLHFTVRPDMVNGFGALHGGVTFSAADSAFAFACNSHGRQSVGLTVTIDYLEAGKVGDLITVEAREESLKHKVGVYQVRATTQSGAVLALFKGTAYRTSNEIL
ncbi:hydroxyphenylacetyl-CoA thioesterase PaaI [Hymenobacter taeanensis]|uniref:Hydroxyphenylacetyl-CoA thioesterase PaaI n=1 Tax=Hymenobacter taeanensis TaxID=2735321 RepID=A0A6M6BJ87_9BACT|nr:MULTISPECIES: hydroxyphenylacetyl-CoA thioesterase PaaI [Hymenobacter]QJX48102.1 hydroxyphenylacetyl-CoA thioesterase PaaI [Hymenobacter taeanensis]UOQ82431.1 hydroxyphenylacetyl-CoA thioesterase PaaI [Hymenobacter sp. 5414T-23]